jgi:hypothetical protein
MASTIIDNGDAGYSTTGGTWSNTGAGVGYGASAQFSHGAAGSTASWTFTGLTPATTYYLGHTWGANAAWASAINIKVYDSDGTTVLLNTTFDETQSPADFTDTGASWHFLGGFAPTGTSLKITITDPGTGYTIADAALLTATLPAITPTTVQNGDWNTGSTWNIGSVPSASSAVALAHAVTITANTIHGDGTDAQFITASSASASLTITGAVLTLKGHAQFGSTGYNSGVRTWLTIQNNGSTPGGIKLDGNSGVAPHIYLGRQAKCVITGQSRANPSYIETKSGSAGDHGFLAGLPGATEPAQYDLRYFRLTRLGSSSVSGLGAELALGATGIARFRDGVIDNCGLTPDVTIDDGDGIFHIENVKWTNALHATYVNNANVAGSNRLAAGTRLVKNCQVYGKKLHYAAGVDVSIIDNALEAGVHFGAALSADAGVISGNFWQRTDGDIVGIGGKAEDNYCYSTTSLASFFHITGNTYQRNIFDNSHPTTSVCMVESESGDFNNVVLNNLALPGAGQILAFNSNPAFGTLVTSRFRHNTFFCASTNAASAGGSFLGMKASTVLDYKSNLGCKLTAGASGNYLFQNQSPATPPEGPPVEVLLATDATHNATWNLVTSSTYSDNSTGTHFDTPMPTGSTAANANGVVLSGNPFVDSSRNLSTWGAMLGAANDAETVTRLMAQYDPTDADYDARYTTTALYTWVSAGFKVTGSQGLLLKDAGHDGVTIGALGFQAASTGGDAYSYQVSDLYSDLSPMSL